MKKILVLLVFWASLGVCAASTITENKLDGTWETKVRINDMDIKMTYVFDVDSMAVDLELNGTIDGLQMLNINIDGTFKATKYGLTLQLDKKNARIKIDDAYLLRRNITIEKAPEFQEELAAGFLAQFRDVETYKINTLTANTLVLDDAGIALNFNRVR